MIDVLLFDLGGVLVDFSGVRDIATLLRVKASEAEILARWTVLEECYAFGEQASCSIRYSKEDYV